ncbi:MAG: hypothetical protein ACLGGX_09610 [Bdellovibrionia bacterium]
MRFLFPNDTVFNKINLGVSRTWMFLVLGEGEKEITNQGRLRVESFSQETGAEDQQAPRIGVQEPKLKIQSQLQDAHDSRTQLPIFFFSQMNSQAT